MIKCKTNGKLKQGVCVGWDPCGELCKQSYGNCSNQIRVSGELPVTIVNLEMEDTVPKNCDINHPKHYTSHPSGVECITVTEHFNFNIGNAIKYLWRMGKKDSEIADLKKAEWYIKREIKRLSEIHITNEC